jgi:hypothetical protein
MKYALITFLLFLTIFQNSSAQIINKYNSFFEKYGLTLFGSITSYDTARSNDVISRLKIPLENSITTIQTSDALWTIKMSISANAKLSGSFDVKSTFICISGQSPFSSVSLNFGFNNWSVKNYVLMPAAVYNGNREKSQRHLYCPFYFDAKDIGIDKPQLISDVPRLNINNGPSRIQQRTGDMSTPAIGFHDPASKMGFWLQTDQETRFGDSGMDIEETDDRSQAVISITAPVVREKYRYFISDMQFPSTDIPADFKAGDSITIQTKIFFFQSPDIQSLYNYFAAIRNSFIPKGKANYMIPFSAAFSIQQEKFNRENFVSDFGYYSVGLRKDYYQDWQIGWTGGMISTYPLLMDGSETSRNNVVRSFDWLFANGIAPSGYFWDSGQKGKEWFGIFQSSPYMKDWHLVRKSADGLYYIFKQFYAFRQLNIPVKPEWEKGARRVADAFVKTWKKYGQLGQYVNNESGEIVVGGSTSGGIVPGTLALAADYFKDPEYLEVAKQIADDYAIKYISKGLIYGGPGDALQNFDSESCYALLEAYTVLYEQTGDPHWLKIAEDVSNQFLTWVSSYDYRFPKSSTLGKLGKTTTGVVWANTQNKHGAPGICTHSGLALLRLYRATGNTDYLYRLQEITNAVPQYLSTKENPILDLNPGWISERVSTTDWLEGIGELFSGSTWAETSLMLTYSEIPGIYADPKSGICISFDQIETKVLKTSGRKMEIEISNPTKYPASVKLFTDNDLQKPLANNYLLNCKRIDLKPGETKKLRITSQ